MISSRSQLVAAALPVLIACGAPEIPELAPRSVPHVGAAVGCWELRPAGWDAGHLRGPRVVSLDTAVARPDSPYGDRHLLRLRVSPLDSVASRLTHWAPYGRDSLYVHLGDGFTGVQLRLMLRNDSLHGRGFATTDVVPAIRHGGAVHGTRVPCPSWHLDG